MISNSPISKNNGIDLFNFKHYAKKVQKIIQNNSNNSEPLTIGVYGKWGEGKTSFLNLINDEIDIWKDKEKGQKGILKYHFNPWRYSTEEEMLFDFFDGLSKMMFVNKDTTLQKIGKQLIKYSRYTKAVKLSASVGFSSNKAGATFDVSEIMKALGEDFIGKEVTLESLIQNINDKLKASKYKIVVFIDDIDRLDKDEIYTILKLIKLNANFNNFVYIVALDENHVAKAIGQRYGVDTKDGELFLEKIINIPIHLPKIESADFKRFFEIKLKEVFDNLGFSNRKEEKNEIRNEFRVQYFKNGREIIRVLNSFFVGAFAIGEEVNLRDLFWIEYLKVKYTNVFDVIKNYNFPNIAVGGRLITIEDIFGVSTSSGSKNRKSMLLEYSKSILKNIFPYKENGVINPQRDIKFRDEKLHINSTNHFEKYFSYHTIGKVSEIKKKLILQNIIDKNKDELKTNLIDLRDKDNLEIHHLYSVIEDFINDENINQEFFYEFLFLNLDLLPEKDKDIFEWNYRLRLIKLIAKIIDDSNLVINLSLSKLNLDELFNFVDGLKSESNFKKKSEESLLEIILNELQVKTLSLIDYHLRSDKKRMIMFLWNKYDKEGFKNGILNSIANIENIKNLIRIFIGYDGEHFKKLNSLDYENIDKLIGVDLIYSKIKDYAPDIFNKVNLDYALVELSNYSKEENLEQFIYHYKNSKI
ncbi:KAP family P-loop NTPase fold protein [Tenacibaculum finnmarkense]|uniref:KAP family P-loop NTPase fold protein n=1 Tax=Tenacibaculum finnmarkense TaxID=2781243 RepID=UPI001EFBC55E|nr:P-loop NTPase fold protein [Tenacibaculum finnmarkense]MCG8206062.1 hypothetical protein [Tenacibaculum finnmarkense genomovar finnmarkense]MCG8722169.1 hypothetical protein [Tenacibaculum finnmarkense]MCG8740493.1 hypothetical protein [Tenacibaculum finnmarkense]MCG8763778.1 hypothetical protein [Tenacibaculum finnmarkense]MCG8776640.1 hypothetical protein [Tenacibaculum finnmarkense]